MFKDPVTTIQFQSALKVKVMTTTAAVATAVGTTVDIADCIESAWPKLKGPLASKFVVSPITTNEDWNLVVESIGSRRCTRDVFKF